MTIEDILKLIKQPKGIEKRYALVNKEHGILPNGASITSEKICGIYKNISNAKKVQENAKKYLLWLEIVEIYVEI